MLLIAQLAFGDDDDDDDDDDEEEEEDEEEEDDDDESCMRIKMLIKPYKYLKKEKVSQFHIS